MEINGTWYAKHTISKISPIENFYDGFSGKYAIVIEIITNAYVYGITLNFITKDEAEQSRKQLIEQLTKVKEWYKKQTKQKNCLKLWTQSKLLTCVNN